MSQSEVANRAARFEPAKELMSRVWPPLGLVLGVAATAAWTAFLIYQGLALLGLAS